MAPALWYGPAIEGIFSGTAARRFDWANASTSVVVSLHTSSYVPDQNAHNFADDLTNELSGNGYARQTLGTKSVNLDTASKTASLRAANTTFPTLGTPSSLTFQYAVIWIDTAGASSTDPLLGYVDLGVRTVTATNFTIDWSDTDGVLKGVYS